MGELTHTRAAMFMTYIAKNSASWAGELLQLADQADKPVRAEAMARFVADMEGRLDVFREFVRAQSGDKTHGG